jgi:hypothetical protein
MTTVSVAVMTRGRRITANLPEQLLEQAMEVISTYRVSGVVTDTSVWIELFSGRPVPALEEALRQGSSCWRPSRSLS